MIGNYLQALGMLSASFQMDPTVQCWWTEDGAVHFSHDREQFRTFVAGDQWRPKYRMWWPDKIHVGDGGRRLAALRSACTEEEVEILDAHAHIASDGSVVLNPILAAMGRSRNATFEKARLQALGAISAADASRRAEWIRCAIDRWPAKCPEIMMSHWWWPAGGYISPYQMLFALDGALCLASRCCEDSYPWIWRPQGSRYRYIAALPTWRGPATLPEIQNWLRSWPPLRSVMATAIAGSTGELPDGTSALYFFGLTEASGHWDRWMPISDHALPGAEAGS